MPIAGQGISGRRGLWITYAVLLTLLHLFLLSIPFLTIPLAWTLTNLLHNCVTFIILHLLKGAPFQVQDQGTSRLLTHWEQIDGGVQWTSTRKFLIVVPILLFLFASFYTHYDTHHFIINFLSMGFVIIPKLPSFHTVRLFGINKY